MGKKSWDSFTGVRSQSFVSDLVSAAQDVSPDDLVYMDSYRLDERKQACGGIDPLRTLVAYAQDTLIYDANDNLVVCADKKRMTHCRASADSINSGPLIAVMRVFCSIKFWRIS